MRRYDPVEMLRPILESMLHQARIEGATEGDQEAALRRANEVVDEWRTYQGFMPHLCRGERPQLCPRCQVEDKVEALAKALSR